MSTLRFADRQDAGRQLAPLLEPYRAEQPVVLGLVRGGVPVAAEVAAALGAPLDALVVRKVGVPGHPELAMGAVAGDTVWLNQPMIEELGVPRATVDRSVAAERREAARREGIFRAGRPAIPVEGRTVIVIDDGLATGATALASLKVLRQRGAGRLVFAAPVCSAEGAAQIGREADAVVCALKPPGFFAVSQVYEDFSQVDDDEVTHALDAAAGSAATERR